MSAKRGLILFVALGVISGCATMNVSSHVERGIRFTQFQTFDWGPADAFPTGDPRLDNNPIFRDQLMGAVEKQMAAHGYRRATDGQPNLLIHYHANVTRRFEVNTADQRYGYTYAEEPAVFEYEEGTIVLDMVDTSTKRVVWRGWAQDNMAGVIDDQDRLERHVVRAVTKMFELFPATSPAPGLR